MCQTNNIEQKPINTCVPNFWTIEFVTVHKNVP
jgi:hypothetical protein